MSKIKALILAALLSISIPVASAEFYEGTHGVVQGSPRAADFIFINSYTGAGQAAGQWNTLYVGDIVPADVKAIYLSGLLIITHGTSQETCDIYTSFRALGNDTPSGFHSGQTIEAHIGGGQRSNTALWVPVTDGYIEFYWYRSTGGNWPTNCAYGVNLAIQAYVR